MHLIVIITLGVFGGLWMFTRWAWRANRPHRREMKRLNRQIRQQEREQSTAEHGAKLVREAAERAGSISLKAPTDWAMTGLTRRSALCL
jgi:hypothetical protein